ncbi:MAG TPA: phosphoribosylanthranilate isomerase [Baekduia sp.]|uniref:phosphoribosylanthranilate isomerase n=1 Tax=Baekduia sp. TaxID=2600305 RepID=UPI002D7A3673|nr:phosphoribosylanthranilate isomerase [Baekduia sp.]HET6509217.1 phosphoribosylanthranilate isomerase [Baekduia sp.]
MSAPRIKFCGMTRMEDAELAVSLDAWAIGMILWPGSKRAADPAVAEAIARNLRRKVEVVGVFVNQSLDEVASLADVIGLTVVQLHGDEGPSYANEVARRTGAKVIKAQPVRLASDVVAVQAFHTDFHLLDTHRAGVRGGTGETFEWSMLSRRRSEVPLILAGGLTPDNVVAAIEAVDPWGVDVASGVESAPGIKDHEKMKAFAEAVRSTAPLVPTPTPPGRGAPVRPAA